MGIAADQTEQDDGVISHALVLCTRHRSADVVGALATVAIQTLIPPVVLVVDSSDDESTRDVVISAEVTWPGTSELRYIHTTPSLTHQRAIGIANTASEVVHFIDDDVRLDSGYIAGVMAVFAHSVNSERPEQPSTRMIAGVGGYMTGQGAKLKVKRFDRWFGLDSDHEGAVLPSGRNIPIVTEPKRAVDVAWLTGAAMSFRRSALELEPPDEIGFPFEGEDVDLSFRIGMHGRLIVTPTARYSHLESSANRVAGAQQARAELCARLLRVANNPQRLSHRRAVVAGVAQLIKFSVAGFITASPRRLQLARGTAQALRHRE